MVFPPILIIVFLVTIPLGIVAVGTYFVHKAWRRRERRNGKRPVRNNDIELGVLEPDNFRTQNHKVLKFQRASAPSFGAALQIHGFDRVSAAASSSKTPQVAEPDSAKSLKWDSQSWVTVPCPGDVSPPEPYLQSTTPPAERSVSPLEQQWPPTHHHGPFQHHHTNTPTYRPAEPPGFREVYEQPRRSDSKPSEKKENKAMPEGSADVDDIVSLGLGRRKSDMDRQRALDLLEGKISYYCKKKQII